MLFVDRDRLFAEATALDETLARAAEDAVTEEDFRISAVTALREVGARVGVRLDPRAEMAIAAGRADAAYNRVVIEFERPGVMHGALGHRGTAHAVDQVKGYLTDLAEQLGVPLADLAGVATDGHWYAFVRNVGGEWLIDGPHARNVTTTSRLLRQLLSLGTGRALTADNLVRDFGTESQTAPQAVRALYRALFQELPGAGLRDALYQEWERLFGAISGVNALEIDERARIPLAQLARRAELTNPEPARLLFALHTYFAIVTKLIAYAAVGRMAVPMGLGLRDWVGLDDTTLRQRVRDLERGGLFRALGLRNFLEGDFFGWYVSCWTPEIAGAIRAISDALDEYDPGSLEARPELTRDLLKGLYQYLMPRRLRHDLGEYYTPDWLAEYVLDRAEFHGTEGERLLDPACGSGTFLVLAIARMKQQGARDGGNERALLQRILQDVVGFDLNPLAVVAARANYVLALGDLLAHRNTDIDIPVYQADSVKPPASAPGLFDNGVYRVELAVESFELPSWVRSQDDVDQVTAALDEAVNNRVPTQAFLERVDALAPAAPTEADRAAISATFHRLAELHETGRNGVWARVLKNAFMPLFVGRFSHVVGNPPWIAWENLSEAYRASTELLWDHYRLHPGLGETALPSRRSRSDMAVLMTYVAADRYLAPNGTLAFLITQSVFKSETAGRGFRRFRLPDGSPLRVTAVDDFVDFQPFEAANNRTAFIALRHGPNAYPVPYLKWSPGLGVGRQPPADLPAARFRSQARRQDWVASPVIATDASSPWVTGPEPVVSALRAVVGPSPYRTLAHEGANTRGANGVFWVERLAPAGDGDVLVRNYLEGGRGELPVVRERVEEDRLYSLLRGRDVQRWWAEPHLEIVLPYLVDAPGTAIAAEEMARRYPRTHAYLERFHERLVARKSFRNFDPATKTPWELYNVGSYTFAPYKVVWREQATRFTAALAPPRLNRPVVPDHKLFSVGLEDLDEAYFVLALLNSTPIRVLVDSYALELSLSSHLFSYAAIPRFSPQDPNHARLSEFGRRAHGAELPGILEAAEEAIDLEAAQLWGLTQLQVDALRNFDAGLEAAEGSVSV